MSDIWPSCQRVIDYITQHRDHDHVPYVPSGDDEYAVLFDVVNGQPRQCVKCDDMTSIGGDAFVIISPKAPDSDLDANDYLFYCRESGVYQNVSDIPVVVNGMSRHRQMSRLKTALLGIMW